MSIIAKNISVSFPGVKALQDVTLQFEPGRVHAVLGANGSGKSTMVKVLTGIYQPDKGCGSKIQIDGQTVERMESPMASNAMGIRVVHQESPLVKTFTVAECIALFKGYPRSGGKINWKAVNQYAKELLEQYGIAVSPQTLTDDLSASERNMVAMAIAMGKDEELAQTKMLILDEADASIPEAEAEGFLHHVREIANLGIPIMMVSHRLKSVMRFCDDISILNDGKLVYTGKREDTTENLIVSKMMKQDDGAQLNDQEEASSLADLWTLLKRRTPDAAGDVPAFEMKNVNGRIIRDFSLRIQPGEIVGIIGVSDSGVGELPRILCGEIPIVSGEMLVCGKPVPRRVSPRTMIRMGVGVLPSDRPVNSSLMSLSLRDNMLLPSEIDYWWKGGLDRKVVQLSQQLFDINPRNAAQTLFGKFSGGNQQKAILGKWLSMCPRLFVLDDPTYGVDPASRLKIFETMKAAADNHVAIIVFSTEPEQLVNVCTRIIGVRDGREACQLRGDELTRESIARWCYI